MGGWSDWIRRTICVPTAGGPVAVAELAGAIAGLVWWRPVAQEEPWFSGGWPLAVGKTQIGLPGRPRARIER